jgi:hypothetical protein
MEARDIIERVNRIDSVYVPHTAVERAILGIEECIARSWGAAEPQNCIITGISGTGKTTSCKAVLSRFPVRDEVIGHCEVTVVPAFYALVPSPCSIQNIASELLLALGDAFPRRGSAYLLTRRLRTLLTRCITQVILLDEFQHLLQSTRRGDNGLRIANWIKGLVNGSRIPIVLIGTPECEAIVDADGQLSRRYQRRFRLTNLDFGGRKKGDFRHFVEDLAGAIPGLCGLTAYPDFSSPSQVLALYAAGGGNPAYTVGLLKEAAYLGLMEGRTAITSQDFARAFDRGVSRAAALMEENPFTLSEAEIYNRLKASPNRTL